LFLWKGAIERQLIAAPPSVVYFVGASEATLLTLKGQSHEGLTRAVTESLSASWAGSRAAYLANK
jgi:hypothetical protein